jgi:hypothetical protein
MEIVLVIILKGGMNSAFFVDKLGFMGETRASGGLLFLKEK